MSRLTDIAKRTGTSVLPLELAGDGEEAGDLLVGLPEAGGKGPAEGTEELGRQRGTRVHDRLHLLVGDGEDLAVRVGDGVGGGGATVEELDLAEEIAGAEDGERFFPDARYHLADAHPALVDYVELAPRRALREDDGLLRITLLHPHHEHVRELLVVEVAEDGRRAQRLLNHASHAPQDVAELFLLRLQVPPVRIGGRDLDGQAAHDLEAVAFEADELPRVVGEQTDLLHPELDQDLRADAVVALVGLEAERLVGLDRVLALVLELIGHQLVDETDAAPLLSQVQQDAPAGLADHLERLVQLVAAVAARGREDVAGQALRVHAHESGLVPDAQVAHHEGDVMLAVDAALEGVDAEGTVAGGEIGLDDLPHQALGAHPMLDEVLDRDQLQAVLAAHGHQTRPAGHGAVLVHHLADHARRVEAGQARQVHRRLRLARAHEHAPVHGAQREHVAGTGQVARFGPRRDGGQHGPRAIAGGDAGRGSLLGFDGHAERGAELRVVLLVAHHERDAQLVQALPRHGQADEAAPIAGHEVDDLGGDLLRGDGEVALVLAVLVVHDHHHPALPDVVDGVGDARERHGTSYRGGRYARGGAGAGRLSTYLAITSISRFTRSPGRAARRFVWSSVYGMTATEKPPGRRPATVREIPSTAIEPFSTR